MRLPGGESHPHRTPREPLQALNLLTQVTSPPMQAALSLEPALSSTAQDEVWGVQKRKKKKTVQSTTGDLRDLFSILYKGSKYPTVNVYLKISPLTNLLLTLPLSIFTDKMNAAGGGFVYQNQIMNQPPPGRVNNTSSWERGKCGDSRALSQSCSAETALVRAAIGPCTALSQQHACSRAGSTARQRSSTPYRQQDQG